MLVDDTERPWDYGDGDEEEPPACEEDESQDTDLPNGLPEADVEDTKETGLGMVGRTAPNSQESETSESDDVSDLSSCWYKDYKEASPRCFNKMLTSGTFLPHGYNAWLTRRNQNQDLQTSHDLYELLEDFDLTIFDE
ncbi:hypothetical protein RvY_10615 [Ramazzottius varieornatus]|uniref:Uncharacterized protein n=1 Tax=Ramazzottius varieornatus TaxID=947166 RepID=A0A1D1VIQ9_RAMVA|nr:hypothetical protein RvY_10615 [Ramazzottius varieornatus]